MSSRVNCFIDRTIKHIRKVQDNMIYLEKNKNLLPFKVKQFDLLRRGLKHDISKFSKKLINGYIIRTEYYYRLSKNLPVDNVNFAEIKKVEEIHHKKERHHSDYKTKMSNIDICEMCCDMCAIAWDKKEKDYTEYFLKTKIKKFPILEQYKNEIVKILLILQDFDKSIYEYQDTI